VEENLSSEKGEWIMTLAQKIKDEGIQQGIQQGLREGIAALLEIKFGDRGLKLLAEIDKISDPARLRQIKDVIKVSQEIQEIEKMLYH
jgi:predicted transposase YdaD